MRAVDPSPLPEGIAGSIARNGLKVLSATWILLPLNFVLGVLVARSLGPEGRGVVALLSGLVALVTAIGHFGFSTAAVYFANKEQWSPRTLVFHYLPVCLFVTGAVWLASLFARPWLQEVFLEGVAVTTTQYWLALAALPLLLVNQFCQNMALGCGRVDDYVWTMLGGGVALLVSTFVAVVILGAGVAGVFGAILFSQSAVSIRLLGPIMRSAREPGDGFRWSRFRHMLAFGSKQHVASIASQVFKRANLFVLSYLAGVTAVGVFSVAFAFHELLLTFPRSINSILVRQMTGREHTEAVEVASLTTRMLFATTGALALLLGMSASWWLPLLYGRDFAPAVVPLVLLLLANAALAVSANLQAFFIAAGKPSTNAANAAVSGLIGLLLAVVLTAKFGLNGNAWAVLGGGLTSAILMLSSYQSSSGRGFFNPVAVTLVEVRTVGRRLLSALDARLPRSPFS